MKLKKKREERIGEDTIWILEDGSTKKTDHRYEEYLKNSLKDVPFEIKEIKAFTYGEKEEPMRTWEMKVEYNGYTIYNMDVFWDDGKITQDLKNQIVETVKSKKDNYDKILSKVSWVAVDFIKHQIYDYIQANKKEMIEVSQEEEEKLLKKLVSTSKNTKEAINKLYSIDISKEIKHMPYGTYEGYKDDQRHPPETESLENLKYNTEDLKKIILQNPKVKSCSVIKKYEDAKQEHLDLMKEHNTRLIVTDALIRVEIEGYNQYIYVGASSKQELFEEVPKQVEKIIKSFETYAKSNKYNEAYYRAQIAGQSDFEGVKLEEEQLASVVKNEFEKAKNPIDMYNIFKQHKK